MSHADKDNITEDAVPSECIDRRLFIKGSAASIIVGAAACDDKGTGDDKAGADKAGADKAGADKAGADKAGADKAAADKAAADKAAADKAAADKAAADKAAAEKKAKAFPLKEDGRLVQVSHKGATTKIKVTNAEVVKEMVHEALKRLTGEADAVKAMGRFIKKDDIVGIKVNCLGAPLASVHPSTAFALADLCHGLGIAKKDIVIYDQYGSRMFKAGFKPQPKGGKDPVDAYPVHRHDTMGYEAERTDLGGFNKNNNKPYKSQLPKVLARFTAVINVCVPKDHDLTGVTGALKNVSYGNVDRVPIYHCKPDCNPKCAHGGMCNVSRIYKHARMGGLVRLVVCDALRVLFQGGPQDNMTFKGVQNAIIASTDPVAIDRAILTMVNEHRATRKALKPIEEDQGGRRAPRFIDAAEKLGLGIGDLKKMKWEKHELG